MKSEQRAELIKKIHLINEEIEKGAPQTPARLKDGKIQFIGTKEEMEEVVGLINTWAATNYQTKKTQLEQQKETLEAQLKEDFDKQGKKP